MSNLSQGHKFTFMKIPLEFRNPLADRKTSNLSSLGALASVMVTGARDWLMQVHLQLCRSPNGSYFFRDYFQFPES